MVSALFYNLAAYSDCLGDENGLKDGGGFSSSEDESCTLSYSSIELKPSCVMFDSIDDTVFSF